MYIDIFIYVNKLEILLVEFCMSYTQDTIWISNRVCEY